MQRLLCRARAISWPRPSPMICASGSWCAQRRTGKGRSFHRRPPQRIPASLSSTATFVKRWRRIPPHRILAVNRGEREGALAVKLELPAERCIDAMQQLYPSDPESPPSRSISGRRWRTLTGALSPRTYFGTSGQ